MSSKKIIACALALTLTAGSVATGFTAFNSDISAGAYNIDSNYEEWCGTSNISFGNPVIVRNTSDKTEVYQYNFTLPQSGTVNITQNNLSGLILCNSNGIAMDNVGSNESYYLNPGKYSLIAKAERPTRWQDGSFQVIYTPSGETFKDSGEGVASNNTVTLNGNKKVNGFFAYNSNDTYDSFKLVVPKRTGVAIQWVSPSKHVTELEIYNSKFQRIVYDDYVGNDGKVYARLNAGTYYVRVARKSYYGGDSYSINLIPYNSTKSHVLKVNTKNVNYKSAGDYGSYVKVYTNNSNDKITYKSSNKKIFTVNSYGYVQFKAPGKAYLYVTAGASDKYDAVTKKVPIIVKPKAVSGIGKKTLKKTSNTCTAKIYWNKDKNVSGYVVKYSSKINKKKALVKAKRIKLKSYKKNSFVLRNIKAGKTIYFKVTPYKKIGKKVYYGPAQLYYYKVYRYF